MWPCTYDFESEEGHAQDSKDPHCVPEECMDFMSGKLAGFIDWASMTTCTRFSLANQYN